MKRFKVKLRSILHGAEVLGFVADALRSQFQVERVKLHFRRRRPKEDGPYRAIAILRFEADVPRRELEATLENGLDMLFGSSERRRRPDYKLSVKLD